jgi:dTDP-glucose pyrophosphorylase
MATTYKLRAECENDITRFQQAMIKNNKTITKVSMEHQILDMGACSFPLPDVDFVFTSEHSLQEIKAVLKTVVDGHVMGETVAKLEDYTGERTYGADEEDEEDEPLNVTTE